MIQRVAYRFGNIIVKAYLNHLLWFTIGVTAGGIYVAALLVPFLCGGP